MESFDPHFLSKVQLITGNQMVSVEELLYDPLKLIFSINEQQPATSHMSEEALYGMWYWIRRSRTFWYGQIARKLPSETPPRAIHEKVSGMLQRQELIYLKALLDHLSSHINSDDNDAIYIFINQAFVDSPGLIKEMHRQEFLYDSKLIPVLVEKVPAMHAAVEAAHALTISEYDDAKEHGQLLLAYLCLQYPSPKALHYAKLLLKSITPTNQKLHILILIASAFPDLIPECKSILEESEVGEIEAAIEQVSARLQLPIYYPPKAPDLT